MTTTPQDNMPADAASENSATANSPPRRRLRKRWIILATLLALVGTSVWWILRDEPLAVMKLPDGRTFTIHKLTYGKEHSFHPQPAALTPVEVWLNRQLARFGRQINASQRAGRFTSGRDSTSVAVWHSFDWSKPATASTPQSVVLTDTHGWHTWVRTHQLQSVPPPAAIAGQPNVPRWLSCGMPTTSPSLQMSLLNARGDILSSTQIPYAIPKTLLESWASSTPTLPVTETSGNAVATITALHAAWSKWAMASHDDVLTVIPELVVTVDGKTSSSWAPMTEGVPYYEYWQAASSIVASVRSPHGNESPMAQCRVSPHESAWKLHLPLTCRNPDEVLVSDRASLGPMKFTSKQPSVGDAPEATAIGRSMARLLGAARAGAFDYEGAGEGTTSMAKPEPLEGWTGNSLKGTLQTTRLKTSSSFSYGMTKKPGMIVRAPQQPMTVSLKFTAPRPHVLISLTETGERFPYVIVKDENGRVLEGELFNAQGLLVWLAKEANDDVELVDVTLLLQKPRVFTFVVPPPKIPPRPVAAAK